MKKRRTGKAPEGSGVRLGTEYKWAILASQTVKKRDANTYDTEMNGLKYKAAYKKAGKDSWSSGVKGQRHRLMRFLQDAITHLEQEELQEKKPQRALTRSRKKS
jgi:DNA-binding ferritin-like protein (Dps family)